MPSTKQKNNPQKAIKFLSFALLALLLALPSAFAINQLLPLHGRVTNSGSSLASGDLRVSIYDAASAGNMVYDSTSDFNGAIQRGIVDVMLGSGSNVLDLNYGTYYYMDVNIVNPSSSNTVVNLDFNGVDRKKFESNRGDDLNANSLGSITSVASQRLWLTSDGNVGVGTSSPNSKLIVATAANGRALVINNSSGNVGVATLSAVPAYSLDVNGGFRVASTGANGLFQNSADANVGIRTITPAGVLHVSNLNGASLTLFRVDANSLNSGGYGSVVINKSGTYTSSLVGINMNPPTYSLDVNGTFRVASNSASTGLFQATDSNVTVGSLDGKNKFAVVGDFNVSPTGLTVPSIYVRATDGNVGIGTNNPIRTLSVVGDVNVFGTVYATALVPSNQWAVSGTNIYYTTGNVGANTNVPNNKLTVVGDFNVTASNTATPSLFVTTDGNVGINSVISKNKLLLIGDLNVATSATATPSLYVNSIDGNVGINMASRPANRLNIIGDLNVVTSATAAPSLFLSPTDGNIGIAGIAASTWRLNVTGNTRVTGYTRITGTSNLVGDFNVAVTAATGAPALFISGTDGNVSVNNAYGKNKLTLVGDLNVTPAGTGSPALFVHPTDGNVGIGTIAGSTFRLDVSGYTRFSNGDVNVQGNKLIVQDINSLNKIYRREAPTADACMGTATLIDGNVGVTTSCGTTNSRVFVTRYGGVFSEGFAVGYVVGTVRSGGFDINSTLATDGNTVAWVIFEPG